MNKKYNKRLKYCIMHDIMLNQCENESCALFPCKYAEISKMLVKSFKEKYPELTTIEGRRIVRRTMNKAFNPRLNQESHMRN